MNKNLWNTRNSQTYVSLYTPCHRWSNLHCLHSLWSSITIPNLWRDNDYEMDWVCRYFTMLPTWQYNLQNTHFKISIFSPTPFARKLPSTLLCLQHILIHTSPTQGTKTSCSRTLIWEDVRGEVLSDDL